MSPYAPEDYFCPASFLRGRQVGDILRRIGPPVAALTSGRRGRSGRVNKPAWLRAFLWPFVLLAEQCLLICRRCHCSTAGAKHRVTSLRSAVHPLSPHFPHKLTPHTPASDDDSEQHPGSCPTLVPAVSSTKDTRRQRLSKLKGKREVAD